MVENVKIATWGVLIGVLLALIIFFVLTRKSKSGKSKKAHTFLIKLIIIISFSVVVGVGSYFLLVPQTSLNNSVDTSPELVFGWKFPVVKFPLTGTDPTAQTFLQSFKSLYATPIDGLITLFLLVAIILLVIAVFQNFIAKKRIEKDLESARMAARNVLEDLRAEKGRLAEAKAKDDALLESIGEGVVATDQTGKMIIMNKVAEDLLGFTSKEIIGKSYLKVVFLEDAQGKQILDAQQPIVLALTLGKTTTTTYVLVRKDGTKFPVAITATPVLLDAKPTGAIVVFRDITKEKEIEKLRVDFLSLASHQLRTPLSGTKWLIETLQRGIIGELNVKQKEYINDIYNINERMIKLVTEMLNVLMLEGGVAVLKKQDVLISKLCEELFVMMEPASRKKGVALRSVFESNTSLSLETDSQVLRSILECFVSNAINYSQNGQEVVLNVKEESDAVLFSVKDNGIGIPKEEQKRIFERFYRASNAKKIRPDGTGLGLYTAFLLTQKAGGKITFESEEGGGTTFYLRVPKKVDVRDSSSTHYIENH